MISIVTEFEFNGANFMAMEEVVAKVTIRPLDTSCLENWSMGLALNWKWENYNMDFIFYSGFLFHLFFLDCRGTGE